MWPFRPRTLTKVLAELVVEHQPAGDLAIDVTVWCAEHDNAIDLEVWAEANRPAVLVEA